MSWRFLLLALCCVLLAGGEAQGNQKQGRGHQVEAMLEEAAGLWDQGSRVSFLGAVASTLTVGVILEEMQSGCVFIFLFYSIF